MTSRTRLVLGSLGLLLASGATAFVWLGSREAPAGGSAFAAAPDPARTPIPLDSAEPIPITVYLSPTCGCCSGWVDHMRANGFEPTLNYTEDLGPIKALHGVDPALTSCHTAVVNGYVIEGHVPAEDVRRLLAEGAPVAGLAAPGMPVGSPGMEMGNQVDPYDVIAFTSDGRARVYASHGR